MHASAADKALEAFRRVDQLLDLRVAVVRLSQGRAHLRGPLSMVMPTVVGTSLAMRSTSPIGHVERAADVFDGGLGRHGVEGDDLRDLLAAVLVGDVLDDFAAAVHAEVDVDIGHRDALGIQEALEEQHVLHRIDVGDLHRVGDERSGGRTAARADGDAIVAWRS